MKTTKGFKFIEDNMKSKEGNCTWKVGEWKHEDEIKLCEKGFHASKTPLQSLSYVYGNKWFIVEAKGKIIEEEGDKFVATDMKLIKELPIKQIVVRFACACVLRNLKNFERQFPNDKRPREAVQAALDFIEGKISIDKLKEAESAAESAAMSAWSAAMSVESAAWSAARSAAMSAWSAAMSAWSAARSAAMSAWSAAMSAWSAAESAAESAAWSAAWSAEKKWQEKTFNNIVNNYLKDIKLKENKE